MDKVRRLITAGATIPEAIKVALKMSIAEFSLKHGRNRVSTAAVIRGALAPNAADIAALQAELGGTEQEWRELLHEAGRPVAALA